MTKTTATRGPRERRRIRNAVIRRDGLNCHWCRAPLTVVSDKPNSLTLDHLIPHSKGGKLRIDNLVPACRPCNEGRGNRGYAEHATRLFLAPLRKEAGLG